MLRGEFSNPKFMLTSLIRYVLICRTESEALPRYSSRNLSREELGKPIKQLTLEAGDMLYFPRGFIHEACTDASSHSLHITVSIYQNTAYVDLLEKLLPEALKLATKHDVEFR